MPERKRFFQLMSSLNISEHLRTSEHILTTSEDLYRISMINWGHPEKKCRHRGWLSMKVPTQLKTSENGWEYRKTPKIIWYHPENNWGPLTDNLVHFEEDFNSRTEKLRWGGVVRSSYLRPVQFLDHLTVIKTTLYEPTSGGSGARGCRSTSLWVWETMLSRFMSNLVSRSMSSFMSRWLWWEMEEMEEMEEKELSEEELMMEPSSTDFNMGVNMVHTLQWFLIIFLSDPSPIIALATLVSNSLIPSCLVNPARVRCALGNVYKNSTNTSMTQQFRDLCFFHLVLSPMHSWC